MRATYGPSIVCNGNIYSVSSRVYLYHQRRQLWFYISSYPSENEPSAREPLAVYMFYCRVVDVLH